MGMKISIMPRAGQMPDEHGVNWRYGGPSGTLIVRRHLDLLVDRSRMTTRYRGHVPERVRDGRCGWIRLKRAR
jgi:hypothetical protein